MHSRKKDASPDAPMDEHSMVTPEVIAEPQDMEQALETATSEGAAPDVSSQIEALKADYDNQIAQLKDQALRAMAETENLRRRAQRDQEETSKYAITGFARDLVSVVENLQRALDTITPDARKNNEMMDKLAEGVDMTLRELLGTFDRHGIRRIEPIGEKFDHNYHQAVVQIEDATQPVGTVAQVLQAGYVIHDRLLRPAMVGVTKQPDSSSEASGGSQS